MLSTDVLCNLVTTCDIECMYTKHWYMIFESWLLFQWSYMYWPVAGSHEGKRNNLFFYLSWCCLLQWFKLLSCLIFQTTLCFTISCSHWILWLLWFLTWSFCRVWFLKTNYRACLFSLWTFYLDGNACWTVEDVPCGNRVAFARFDQFITKNATLTNEKEVDAHPIRAMKFSVACCVCCCFLIMQVAVCVWLVTFGRK